MISNLEDSVRRAALQAAAEVEAALGPAHRRCAPEAWEAWEALRDLLTGAGGGEPVRYGPGRGLWAEGRGWVVTHGPGATGSRRWKSKLGKTYPSFHCSSLTNFFLSWLVGRQELYTHSGNIPPLDTLISSPSDLNAQKGAAPFRGFAGLLDELPHPRNGLTWPQVLEAEAALGTFHVFAQSTYSPTRKRWKWWHHTGLLLRHPSTGALSRVAADGFKGAGGVWSATPIDEEQVTPQWAAAQGERVLLRVWRVRPRPDGTFGDLAPTRVTLEIE